MLWIVEAYSNRGDHDQILVSDSLVDDLMDRLIRRHDICVVIAQTLVTARPVVVYIEDYRHGN